MVPTVLSRGPTGRAHTAKHPPRCVDARPTGTSHLPISVFPSHLPIPSSHLRLPISVFPSPSSCLHLPISTFPSPSFHLHLSISIFPSPTSCLQLPASIFLPPSSCLTFPSPSSCSPPSTRLFVVRESGSQSTPSLRTRIDVLSALLWVILESTPQPISYLQVCAQATSLPSRVSTRRHAPPDRIETTADPARPKQPVAKSTSRQAAGCYLDRPDAVMSQRATDLRTLPPTSDPTSCCSRTTLQSRYCVLQSWPSSVG
ncbi:hypothetical protein Q31a_10830 [Aureliella helgolandensis]|uniref:Uncharacterized protein n=1 Tax=Aureliella helgolandensis TaxID=2527968 RepID=A0A518G2H8_9BACT|nr:hypothetical protein Q31a_10830 [Aureliella helgolandensis]